MNLPGINVVVIAAILIGVGTLLAAAEAQTDTRHASLPPDAEQVLIWKSGHFNLSCTTSEDRHNIQFVFYRDIEHNYRTDYFTEVAGHPGPTREGILQNLERSAEMHFQLLDTGINGSNWYAYGLAYGNPLCSGGGERMFDFKVAGNCDGSTITVQTSDGFTNMTQATKSEPRNNYDVWCGFIPDAPIGTLGNKIF